MIYICEAKGYQIYQNDEGNLEGYKSSGIILEAKNIRLAKNSNSIVSNTSDLEEFIKNFLTKKRTKTIKEDNSKQLDMFQ